MRLEMRVARSSTACGIACRSSRAESAVSKSEPLEPADTKKCVEPVTGRWSSTVPVRAVVRR